MGIAAFNAGPAANPTADWAQIEASFFSQLRLWQRHQLSRDGHSQRACFLPNLVLGQLGHVQITSTLLLVNVQDGSTNYGFIITR